MGSADALDAGIHQRIKGRRGIGVGIGRKRREYGEIALRRDTLVRAVHRIVAIAQRVDAGLHGLAAAVIARSGETQDAEQRSLRYRQDDSIVGWLGAGG